MAKPRTPKRIEQTIRRMYESGIGAVDVAKKARVGVTTVYRVLLRLGVAIRRERSHDHYRAIPRERHGALVAAYRRGVPPSKLAEQEGCSASTVRQTLRDVGEPPFPRGQVAMHRRPAMVARVVRLYKSGMSQRDVAAELGCSQVTVSNVLRHAGVKKRTSSGAQMRDGAGTNDGGYLLVKVLFGDPMFCMANQNGYVLAHRLEMARSLRRPLEDHERPHHKNGDRTDNRVKRGHELGGCKPTCCNLELWSVSQPAGQRVADKVAWAKAILKQYT